MVHGRPSMMLGAGVPDSVDWHHQFEGRPPRLPTKPRASAPPPTAVASKRLATPAPARYPIYKLRATEDCDENEDHGWTGVRGAAAGGERAAGAAGNRRERRRCAHRAVQ